jgi:hypothetical protein
MRQLLATMTVSVLLICGATWFVNTRLKMSWASSDAAKEALQKAQQNCSLGNTPVRQ